MNQTGIKFFLLPEKAYSLLDKLKSEQSSLFNGGQLQEHYHMIFDEYQNVTNKYDAISAPFFNFFKGVDGGVARVYCLTNGAFMNTHIGLLDNGLQEDGMSSEAMVASALNVVDINILKEKNIDQLIEVINERYRYKVVFGLSLPGRYTIRARKCAENVFELNFGSLSFKGNHVTLFVKEYILAVICEIRGGIFTNPWKYVYNLSPDWIYYDVDKVYDALASKNEQVNLNITQ